MCFIEIENDDVSAGLIIIIICFICFVFTSFAHDHYYYYISECQHHGSSSPSPSPVSLVITRKIIRITDAIMTIIFNENEKYSEKKNLFFDVSIFFFAYFYSGSCRRRCHSVMVIIRFSQSTDAVIIEELIFTDMRVCLP